MGDTVGRSVGSLVGLLVGLGVGLVVGISVARFLDSDLNFWQRQTMVFWERSLFEGSSTQG